MGEPYGGANRCESEITHLAAIEAVVEHMMIKMLAQYEENERAMLKEVLTRSFPGGDPESHREYHQSKIDAAKAEQEFYTTLKYKLAEAGALGVLRTIMWLLIAGFGATVAAKLGVLPAFLAAIGGK